MGLQWGKELRAASNRCFRHPDTQKKWRRKSGIGTRFLTEKVRQSRNNLPKSMSMGQRKIKQTTTNSEAAIPDYNQNSE
jgi:hypothetical protein